MTSEWKRLRGRRVEKAAAELGRIAREFKRRAPASALRLGFENGLELLLDSRAPLRERLLLDPAFDYWLFLWEKHFGVPGPEENWRLQFGLLQGFAAASALAGGRPLETTIVADEHAHVHIYGTPLYVELPKALALAALKLRAGPGGLELRAPGGRVWKASRQALDAHDSRSDLGRGAALRRFPLVAGSMQAAGCGLLLTQGVIMHGLARLDEKRLARFCGSLETALARLGKSAPELREEMLDLVTALVPLADPEKHGSVSSSYVNLRGAVCLSHSDDPLLQAETLIHEFCHQKMNHLLAWDPILMPGQSAQIFWSPWRPDARRLRGLILGAHAFLNVADFLLGCVDEAADERERVQLMCSVARRLFEVEAALESAMGYGTYTEFGAGFMLEMSRRLRTVFHGAQVFPTRLVDEARERVAAHRSAYCLPLTGIYKERDAAPAAPAQRYAAASGRRAAQ